MVESLIVSWITLRMVVENFASNREQITLTMPGKASLWILTEGAILKPVGGLIRKEGDLVSQVPEGITERTCRQARSSQLEVVGLTIWKELVILMAQRVLAELVILPKVLVHILETVGMAWTAPLLDLMAKTRIEAEVLLFQMAHGLLLLLTAIEVGTVPRILVLPIPLGPEQL